MKSARPKRTRLRAQGKPTGPSLPEEGLSRAVDAIGHRFKDRELLVRALTHPSATPPHDAVRYSNQRLEFLGDRVLNLIVAERLIVRRKEESEGDLAPRLNRLVKKEACAEAMRHLGLGEFILMSDGECASGGQDRDSTLGDACEAVIAAIYLDGGLGAARKFVERAWAPQFAAPPAETRDPKSLLQEYAQAKGLGLPDYEIVGRTGPDHAPNYKVTVRLGKDQAATGEGGSKRDAERAAAVQLLGSLEDAP